MFHSSDLHPRPPMSSPANFRMYQTGSNSSSIVLAVEYLYGAHKNKSHYAPMSLPYLTLPSRWTPHRQHPALRPLGGPIARPHKAEGYKNLPEALASFRSKGHRMLHNS